MPALENQKWEIYAQGLARGMTSDAAHTAAGYRPNRKNAVRLKATQVIIDRVLELQGKRENRLALNKAYVIEALLENAEKALGRRPVKISRRVKVGDGEYEDEIAEVFVYEGQVANAAIKMAGSELGLFVERKDFRILNEFAKLSNEELAEELAQSARLLLEDQSKVIDHEEGET